MTEALFTPRSLRLAISSKNIVRQNLALSHAFPLDKDVFLWDCIKTASQAPGQGSQQLAEVLQRTEQDALLKEHLLAFVSDAFHCSFQFSPC